MTIRVWQGAAQNVVCGEAILQAGDIEFKGERIGVLTESDMQTVFFNDGSGKIAACLFRSDRKETDQAYVYVFPSLIFAKLFFGKELELLAQ